MIHERLPAGDSFLTPPNNVLWKGIWSRSSLGRSYFFAANLAPRFLPPGTPAYVTRSRAPGHSLPQQWPKFQANPCSSSTSTTVYVPSRDLVSRMTAYPCSFTPKVGFLLRQLVGM